MKQIYKNIFNKVKKFIYFREVEFVTFYDKESKPMEYAIIITEVFFGIFKRNFLYKGWSETTPDNYILESFYITKMEAR